MPSPLFLIIQVLVSISVIIALKMKGRFWVISVAFSAISLICYGIYLIQARSCGINDPIANSGLCDLAIEMFGFAVSFLLAIVALIFALIPRKKKKK